MNSNLFDLLLKNLHKIFIILFLAVFPQIEQSTFCIPQTTDQMNQLSKKLI